MRRLEDDPAGHRAMLRSKVSENTHLAIFMHGFTGTYLGTWGKLAQHLQTHADDDAVLAPWDFLFLGYETYSLTSFLEIAELIATSWRHAKRAEAPFTRSYSKVALFGHSLGTLGIRQLLCAPLLQPKILTDIHKVTLLGSPLNGSELARIGRWRRWDTAIRKRTLAPLAPGSFSIADSLLPNSHALQMLHEWNETVIDMGLKLPPVVVIQGSDDFVVGGRNLVSWPGDQLEQTPYNHSKLSVLEQSTSGLLDAIKRGLQ